MTYENGYMGGLRRASLELRRAGQEHVDAAGESKSIVVSSAHISAARLLRSWAESFDIIADEINRKNGA